MVRLPGWFPGPAISAMVAGAVLFAAAAHHGIAPANLCGKVGLEPDLVADIDGRVPAAVMEALWEEAGRSIRASVSIMYALRRPRTGSLPRAGASYGPLRDVTVQTTTKVAVPYAHVPGAWKSPCSSFLFLGSLARQVLASR
jgi:hypothetical protein